MGKLSRLGMSSIIEIVMLSAAAIILYSNEDGRDQGNARFCIPGRDAGGDRHLRYCLDGRYLSFRAIWHSSLSPFEGIVRQMPWLFGVALFVMSILLYSQAATVRALDPAGHRVRYFSVYADRLIPRRERIFLYPELPDRRSRH